MTAVSSRSSKAQLLAHIVALDTQLVALGRQLEAARLTRAVTQPPAAQYQAPVATHKAYYDYVAQQRRAQRGAKVVAYKTFAQWSAGSRSSPSRAEPERDLAHESDMRQLAREQLRADISPEEAAAEYAEYVARCGYDAFDERSAA